MIRSLIYYIIFSLNLLIFSIIFLPLFFLPRSMGLLVLTFWARVSQSILFYLCEVDFEVYGKEYIPKKRALIASKHQSTWETINFLHILDQPPVMILKKELLFIPFFGQYALKFGNIAINRKAGVSAIKDMVKKAKKSRDQNRSILIFPEGTRSAINSDPEYKRGILALYKNLKIPCVPVALNSGLFWPKNKLMKKPGKISVEFLKPIEPGLEDDEFMRQLQTRIEDTTNILIKKHE